MPSIEYVYPDHIRGMIYDLEHMLYHMAEQLHKQCEHSLKYAHDDIHIARIANHYQNQWVLSSAPYAHRLAHLRSLASITVRMDKKETDNG